MQAAARRCGLDLSNVVRTMHSRQLFPGRERCVHVIEKTGETRRDQLIVDGAQARGAFRMHCAHVVQQTVGM